MRATRLLITAVAAWVATGLVAAFVEGAALLWLGFGALLAVALIYDALRLRGTASPQVVRDMPSTLSLAAEHDVTLRVTSRSRRSVELRITEDIPATVEIEGLPERLVLDRGHWADVTFKLRPLKRGDITLGAPHVELYAPLGLLRQVRRLGEPQDLRVFPNFRSVMRYAALATENRISAMGIHLQRRRGQGTEFHQLREYRAGDPLRQIDWNAVSRRQALISREYREEQHQRVVFLLDCGRRMRTMDGEIAHFDHALNAVILLSYVALRQGDSVGLMTFSGPTRWQPPVRGAHGVQRILNAVYDLETTTAPSDYFEATKRLSARQRRRSLVVIVTNLRDEGSEELQRALTLLRRRHLVLIASLREPALADALESPVMDLTDAVRYAATTQYLDERTRAHKELGATRHFTTDVEPQELPIALVNNYLAIKRAGLL